MRIMFAFLFALGLGLVVGFILCLLWLAATIDSPNGYALFGLF